MLLTGTGDDGSSKDRTDPLVFIPAIVGLSTLKLADANSPPIYTLSPEIASAWTEPLALGFHASREPAVFTAANLLRAVAETEVKNPPI